MVEDLPLAQVKYMNFEAEGERTIEREGMHEPSFCHSRGLKVENMCTNIHIDYR